MCPGTYSARQQTHSKLLDCDLFLKFSLYLIEFKLTLNFSLSEAFYTKMPRQTMQMPVRRYAVADRNEDGSTLWWLPGIHESRIPSEKQKRLEM
jgi:hypothetical protein